MKSELMQCLGEIQESIDAYRRGAEELGNGHVLPIDPKYISLLTAKASLLVAISNIDASK